MRPLEKLPPILAGLYLLLLLYLTFGKKLVFVEGRPYFNLFLLLPVGTFYGVFYSLYRNFKETKSGRILWMGLTIGLGLFVLLLLVIGWIQ